jgi:hypothetical protein
MQRDFSFRSEFSAVNSSPAVNPRQEPALVRLRADRIRKRMIETRAYEAVGLRESDFRAVLALASDLDIINAGRAA